MPDLIEKYAHYRRRLIEAMKARKLTNEALAEKIGGKTHPVTISKLRNGTLNLDDEWRAKTAAAINLPVEVLYGEDPLPEPRPFEIWVSPKRPGRRAMTPANENRMLSLYGMAAGSINGALRMTAEPIDEVPCPPKLADVIGAYALRTSGESMVPRYFPGDHLYVNPHQRVKAGDHVIIQVMRHDNSGTETWVKRFDSEDAEAYHVWQYNPPARVSFKKKYVMHVHRVLPINELF